MTVFRWQSLALVLLCCASALAKPVALLSKPIDVDHKFLVQQAELNVGPDKDFTNAKVKFTVKNISGRSLKMGTFDKKSVDEPWFGFQVGLPPEVKSKMNGTSLGPLRTKDIAPDEVFTVEPSLGLPGKVKFTWIQLSYNPYFGSKKQRTITARIPLAK